MIKTKTICNSFAINNPKVEEKKKTHTHTNVTHLYEAY
jgi:hypothetical protein